MLACPHDRKAGAGRRSVAPGAQAVMQGVSAHIRQGAWGAGSVRGGGAGGFAKARPAGRMASCGQTLRHSPHRVQAAKKLRLGKRSGRAQDRKKSPGAGRHGTGAVEADVSAREGLEHLKNPPRRKSRLDPLLIRSP